MTTTVHDGLGFAEPTPLSEASIASLASAVKDGKVLGTWMFQRDESALVATIFQGIGAFVTVCPNVVEYYGIYNYYGFLPNGQRVSDETPIKPFESWHFLIETDFQRLMDAVKNL